MQETAKRLEALSSYGILDTPPEPEFDDIVTIAQRVCQTPVALVSLVAEDRQWFKARVGFPGCQTPLTQSVCVHALDADGLLVIPDLTLDERTRNNSLVTGPPHIRFYAGAALLTPDGIAIGSLCVIDDKARPGGLSAGQADTLRELARQTMVVMALRKAMAARDAALVEQRRQHEASLERAQAIEAVGERMRNAEALVREAQEAARVGAFEVDIATNRFQVTAEFCRIFGLPRQDLFDASELEDLVLLPDRVSVASSRTTRRDATAAQDVEYRIRRKHDGALRWISRRGSFAWNADGEPVRMLGVVQDVTDRKLVEIKTSALITLGDQLRGATTTRAVESIAARLLGETLGVSRAGYGIVDEVLGTYAVESDWVAPGMPSLVGTWPVDAFRTTITALRDGAPFVIANVPAASWLANDAETYRVASINAQINVPLVESGALVGVLFAHNDVPRTWKPAEVDFAVAVADRTYAAIAKVKAEEHQRVLNEELSHRLKNTLSMVQAIITQTLRGHAERPVIQSLEDRIIALSKGHDILMQQSWTAAPVSAIVDSVLGLHGRLDRFVVSGPTMTLGPKATLSLSLLLHELTTNSIKYGALSVEIGRVLLNWRIERDGVDPTLLLEWVEKGGPSAVAPTKKGFGSRLIGMGLAGTGDAKLDFRPEGLRADFRAPLRLLATH